MARSTNARRVYGTGSIVEHAGAFYGKWRVDGRQVKRKLGAVRQPRAQGGLTRKQAERRLRELMAETVAPASSEALTFEQAGTRDLKSPGWRVSPAQQVPQAPTRTPAKSPCRWPAGEVSLARAEGVVAPREPCSAVSVGAPLVPAVRQRRWQPIVPQISRLCSARGDAERCRWPRCLRGRW